jgi:aminoglycoside 3-N-acetyltransferase
VRGPDRTLDGVHRMPVARAQLLDDLRRLGVTTGQTLLVHGSLRSIGLVDGGARTVVDALCAAVGETGHVVAPTGTEENSLTSHAYQARIAGLTQAKAEAYTRAMPAFDQDATPTTMGAISEALRTAPGAVRSAHPQSSFAAVGPRARDLMEGHLLDCHLGEHSPLAKLCAVGAHVLFLGVGYEACTAFHLAEYRYRPDPPRRTYSCVVSADGRSRWETFQDVVLDDRDFAAIGESLAGCSFVKYGYVGSAQGRLMPMIQAVNHAIGWMAEHRC